MMKKTKILFIQPTPYDIRGKLIKKKKLYFVGLAMPLLVALTPDKYHCEIILETIEEVPFDTDADIIGISSMGHAVMRSIDIAKEFKRRGKTVIMGGYMVSLMADEAKKYCDSVVIGDAEEVWSTVLSDFEAGELKPFYKEELVKLSYPLPRYDLIVNKNIGDFLPVQAGRGCPHSCSFCSVSCLYRSRYYRRDIQEVIRDINHVKSLGFNKILLLDDNILSDREYFKEICAYLKQINMKWLSQCEITIGYDNELLAILAGSGCMALSFGLESISKESLDSMDKKWAQPEDYSRLISNIRSYGIDVSTEMVVGADGDTLKSIADTAKFITDNKIVVPRFYILTPIPGTDFHKEMVLKNRIYNTDMYSYNSAEAVHIPKNMTPEQLTDAYWDLYKKVFSIKSIFNRTILQPAFLKSPGKYIFYFFVNLYYREQIYKSIVPNII